MEQGSIVTATDVSRRFGEGETAVDALDGVSVSQRRHEDERAVVVRRHEHELERVVDLDVEHARGEHEQARSHEQAEADPIESVRDRADHGFSNSFGITAQSFARRIGTAASPVTMCSPWVAAYSHAGLVGQRKK